MPEPDNPESAEPPTRVQLLGTPVDLVTEETVLAFVRGRITAGRPVQIATVNAEFVMLARRNASFREVLQGVHMATPDGAGVVWAVRRAGYSVPARVGGSDLVWSLSEQGARLGHRLFLLGGSPGVADSAARVLEQRYPGLQIAGTYSGSPADEEVEGIVDLIRRAGADIVLVAFGAPEQDMWIAHALDSTGAACGIGVGGSFDYVAGRARRAPLWMQQRGLEWLWRLIRQPWRWKRMMALPRFAWLVLRSDRAVVRDERTER